MASQQHHSEKGAFPSYQDRQLPTLAGDTALAVLPSLPFHTLSNGTAAWTLLGGPPTGQRLRGISSLKDLRLPNTQAEALPSLPKAKGRAYGEDRKTLNQE